MTLTLAIRMNVVPKESTALGVFTFVPETEADVLTIKDATIHLPSRTTCGIQAIFLVRNSNLTVSAVHQGEHVFTGMSHWDKVAPYFACRLATGEFIQMYFKRTD